MNPLYIGDTILVFNKDKRIGELNLGEDCIGWTNLEANANYHSPLVVYRHLYFNQDKRPIRITLTNGFRFLRFGGHCSDGFLDFNLVGIPNATFFSSKKKAKKVRHSLGRPFHQTLWVLYVGFVEL